METFYDTHAHLHDPAFRADRNDLLARARTAGITRILCVGTDLASSRQALTLADSYPEVYAAVGWHPCEADEAPASIARDLRALAAHPKVVALGETGLDHYHLPSRRGGTLADDARLHQFQKDLFRVHLDLAAELGLGCVVHQRESLETVLEVYAPYAHRVPVQFHCFVGNPAVLQRVLALGAVVSFTGVVTFKNAADVRAAAQAAPLDRMMLETDAPYLAPLPYRGQRCEPAYVRETAVAVAQVKGVSLEELGRATCATAHRFFTRMG